MELLYKSARELVDDLNAKRVSAIDLLEAHLERHRAVHDRINAVIRTDLEPARRDARAVDEARARGETLGPLAGLPMTIKDGLDVEGLPAHSGNKELVGRARDCSDAEVVRRARAAGAIIWGKTNVPYMLADWQSYNGIYGTTNNPFDLSRTSGGSSGGAAAALAAGVTPLEIGSDIGGSLRHPANFCGVFSCKPTWGLLPQTGHVPPVPGQSAEVDLNVVGPMARTADDLRLLFRVLANTDLHAASNGVSGLRVATWTQARGVPLCEETSAAVQRAAVALEQAGAKATKIAPPVNMNTLIITYRDLLTEIVRADMRDAPPTWALRLMKPLFALQRAFGADPLSLAGYSLAITASPARLAQARKTRDALKTEVARFFEGYDLIVAPVMARTAIPHLQKGSIPTRQIDVDGHAAPYTSFLHWVALATLLHLPAVVAPTGLSREGLPIGVQLIGPWGSEERLFDAAAAIEAGLGGFQRPTL